MPSNVNKGIKMMGMVSRELVRVLHSDNEWHSTTSLAMAVGAYIRPEVAMRAAKRYSKAGGSIDQGRGAVVGKILLDWRNQGRVENRHNGRYAEWLLRDRVWASAVLEVPAPSSSFSQAGPVDEARVREIVREEISKLRLVWSITREGR